VMSVEQALQWHIAQGYNAVVITDHNWIDTAFEAQKLAREKYNDSIKVIVGMEYTNCRLHMGLVGITEYIEVLKTPTDEQLQEVINKVHAMGGVVVANHRAWTYYAGLSTPSIQDLAAWGVDYIDVTTAGGLDLQMVYYAREAGLGVATGSDIHSIGYANEWMLLNATEFSEEAIMEALRSRKSSFIFDNIGYPAFTNQDAPVYNPKYIYSFPFIIIGQFFHQFFYQTSGTYSFVDGHCGDESKWVYLKKEMAVCIGWLFLAWIFFEILFAIFKGFLLLIKMLYWRLRGRQPSRRYQRAHLLGDDDDGDDDTPLTDIWSK